VLASIRGAGKSGRRCPSSSPVFSHSLPGPRSPSSPAVRVQLARMPSSALATNINLRSLAHLAGPRVGQVGGAAHGRQPWTGNATSPPAGTAFLPAGERARRGPIEYAASSRHVDRPSAVDDGRGEFSITQRAAATGLRVHVLVCLRCVSVGLRRRRRLRLFVIAYRVSDPPAPHTGKCSRDTGLRLPLLLYMRCREQGSFRRGTPFPWLECLRTHYGRHCKPFSGQKCTRLQDFAYISQNFTGTDIPGSP